MNNENKFKEIKRRHDRLLQLHDILKTDYISSIRINPEKSTDTLIGIKQYEKLIENDEKILMENGVDFKHAVYLEIDIQSLSIDTYSLYQKHQANQALALS